MARLYVQNQQISETLLIGGVKVRGEGKWAAPKPVGLRAGTAVVQRRPNPAYQVVGQPHVSSIALSHVGSVPEHV